MTIAGESRRSSVSALNVSPHAPTTLPASEPPTAVAHLLDDALVLRAVDVDDTREQLEVVARRRAPRATARRRPSGSTNRRSRDRDGGTGSRCARRSPCRSRPRARRRRRASQRFAIALMNDTFVARNAFDAYLIISADAGSVTSTGALHALVELGDAHRGFGLVAADHDAIGIEEVAHRLALAQELGIRRDRDALVRDARLRTARAARSEWTRRAPSTCSRRRCSGRAPARSRARRSRRTRGRPTPSAPCGVCTQRNTMSAPRAATAAPTTNSSRRAASPSASSSGRPASRIGTLALLRAGRRARRRCRRSTTS